MENDKKKGKTWLDTCPEYRKLTDEVVERAKRAMEEVIFYGERKTILIKPESEEELLDLEALSNSIRDLRMRSPIYPALILMHPNDAKKFIEARAKETGCASLTNLMVYQGISIRRSLDVKEGKWEIY